MAEKKDPNDIILGKKHEAIPSVEMKLAEKPSESHADLTKRLHPILTNEQYHAAQEKARKRVTDEAIKAAMSEVEAKTYEEARLAAGFVIDGPAMDIVHFTVNLPDPKINSCLGPINGAHVYWHGRTYQLPRHVANSLAEMQFRLWYYSAREIKGEKLRDFYQRPHDTVLGADGEVVGGSIPSNSIRAF
jgi:hypothetical protein